MMKFRSAPLTLLILAILPLSTQAAPDVPASLTAEEKASGWQLLFDGVTTNGWRGFRSKTFPRQGWVVENGCLKKIGKVRGGDIISLEQFSEFDLQWEWRVPPRCNNGLKYFVVESRGAIGHEYQMIDDALIKNPKGSTASFYDVLPPRADKPLNPPGEWNHSRVLVKGTHVEHWLNGTKVVEFELGSPAVKAAVAESKFKDVPGFGDPTKGHILLTDHGDEAWYRNIKIRNLASPSS
jgi:hypothetical protein